MIAILIFEVFHMQLIGIFIYHKLFFSDEWGVCYTTHIFAIHGSPVNYSTNINELSCPKC